MAYSYIKKLPKTRKVRGVNRQVFPKWFVGSLSFVCFVLGLVLVGSVAWPLIQWQFLYRPSQLQEKYISPIPSFVSSQVLASSSESAESIVNWLPTATHSANPSIKFYTISIPKLRIESATVEYGGTDLKKSLIGWTDSALPGNLGNNVIFGHSTLPQFYNPKNYTSIFSLLPTLKKGDPIYISYDGVSYKYVVFDMKTVEPEDYSILEQQYDNSYVSLITCVPPGTYWKRLIVKARVNKF